MGNFQSAQQNTVAKDFSMLKMCINLMYPNVAFQWHTNIWDSNHSIMLNCRNLIKSNCDFKKFCTTWSKGSEFALEVTTSDTKICTLSSFHYKPLTKSLETIFTLLFLIYSIPICKIYEINHFSMFLLLYNDTIQITIGWFWAE